MSGEGERGVDPAWLVAAATGSSDLVAVIDEDTTILWCNEGVRTLLGHDPSDVVGRALAEFLHPDDLVRAAEVMELAGRGAFDAVPITPALYRLLSADGSWTSLEVNATSGPDGNRMLIVARAGGDLVIGDHLLEAVTNGESFDRQVDLVIELGRWRHPDEGYAVLFRDDDGTPRARTSSLPPELYGAEPVDGPTPWSLAMAQGTDLAVEDLGSVDARHPGVGPELAAAARAAGFHGCLAAPVGDPGHADDSCIVIWTTAEGPTTAGHRYAMENMRRALTLVLQQRAQLLMLRRAAEVDDLTGLVSRARFFDLLAEVEEAGGDDSPVTLLYVDLDGFKSVNDRFGHTAGDRVLAEAAARMAALAPPGSVVARLGGDEFAVLLADQVDAEGAAAVAQRMIDAMCEPIELGVVQVQIGASVGLATGSPGEAPQAVLDAADLALYAAKADGRGRWHPATEPPPPDADADADADADEPVGS